MCRYHQMSSSRNPSAGCSSASQSSTVFGPNGWIIETSALIVISADLPWSYRHMDNSDRTDTQPQNYRFNLDRMFAHVCSVWTTLQTCAPATWENAATQPARRSSDRGSAVAGDRVGGFDDHSAQDDPLRVGQRLRIGAGVLGVDDEVGGGAFFD